MAEGVTWISVKRFAEATGISVQMVYKLAQAGVIDSPTKGQLPWPASNINYCKHLRGKRSYGDTLTDERTKLTKIQAEIKDLELRQLKGELIETEKAQAMWGAVMMTFISKLEAMENKLPPLVFGLSMPEIQVVVRNYIYEMRMELANPDLREIALQVSREIKKQKERKTSHGKSKGKKKTGKHR